MEFGIKVFCACVIVWIGAKALEDGFHLSLMGLAGLAIAMTWAALQA